MTTRTTVDATIDALAKPAIKNGTMKDSARARAVKALSKASPVVQTRQPVGYWVCDTCGAHGYGYGWPQMQAEAQRGHTVFTAVKK